MPFSLKVKNENFMKNLTTFCFGIALLSFIGLGCNLFNVKEPEIIEIPKNAANNQSDNNRVPNDSAAAGDSNTPAYSNSKAVPKTVSGGVLNGKATNLVQPAYPPAAKAVRASGAVNVQVTVDEKGDVISANAVSGHPLLRSSAAQAARSSKFSPTLLSGKPVKVTGVIVYNFTPE